MENSGSIGIVDVESGPAFKVSADDGNGEGDGDGEGRNCTTDVEKETGVVLQQRVDSGPEWEIVKTPSVFVRWEVGDGSEKSVAEFLEE